MSRYWDWSPSQVRFLVMASLGDGAERTTVELSRDHPVIRERIYQALKRLESKGLVRIRKDVEGRLHAQVIYNPELLELDVLNTVPDDGGYDGA